MNISSYLENPSIDHLSYLPVAPGSSQGRGDEHTWCNLDARLGLLSAVAFYKLIYGLEGVPT